MRQRAHRAAAILARLGRQRNFIVTPYAPGGDGRLQPAIPFLCLADGASADTCRVAILRYRGRKTGPCFPIAVVHCSVHGSAFTLYPPGFAPYLRQPLERLAPDGADVSKDPIEGGKDPVQVAFAGTFFDAALAAADGRAWPRSSDPAHAEDSYWETQRRRLAETSRILGVAPDLDERRRDDVSRLLGVDALLIRELATKTTPRGYRAIGHAIVGVLRAVLAKWAKAALRILSAGFVVGRFGKAFEWDPRRHVLRSLAFPASGIDAPG